MVCSLDKSYWVYQKVSSGWTGWTTIRSVPYHPIRSVLSYPFRTIISVPYHPIRSVLSYPFRSILSVPHYHIRPVPSYPFRTTLVVPYHPTRPVLSYPLTVSPTQLSSVPSLLSSPVVRRRAAPVLCGRASRSESDGTTCDVIKLRRRNEQRRRPTWRHLMMSLL